MDGVHPPMNVAETLPASAASVSARETSASGLAAATVRWSLAARVGFRFAFAYLVLYMLPAPLGILPGTDWPEYKVHQLWDALVTFMGTRLFGLSEVATENTGSGDRMADWLKLLAIVVFSVVATLVWSIADRRRLAYPTLAATLRVYVRYYLAFVMFGYGIVKVIKVQFPFPGAGVLLEPYGEGSPMRLAWTFMGYSTAYTVFCGAGEILGAVLLFFRRTTTLGALVLVTVLANVVMINFSYDVPVKLFSSNLLLMAGVLALPDVKRLTNVFFFNRPAAPARERAPLPKRWMRWAHPAIKVVGIAAVLIPSTLSAWNMWSETNAAPAAQGLDGTWQVDSFRRGGVEIPPLETDGTRWKRAAFYGQTYAGARTMTGESVRFRLEKNTEKAELTLTRLGAGDQKSTLTYAQADADRLTLKGDLEGSAVEINLTRVDVSKLPLVSRGFHWVNEVPYAR